MNSNEAVILIVDDQFSGREVLRGLLTGQGYQLEFAGSGEEALSQAAKYTPDLILLDVMMPTIDGFEVCRRLRADPYLAEIPIIMVTALDDNESRLKGIEAGADDFVSKPFNHVELKTRVRNITRLNRYRRLLAERHYRHEAEEEVYRRNRELVLLNHVVIAAASTLNVEEALYIACEALAQAFDLPQAIAILLNEEHTQFTARVAYQSPGLQLEPSDEDEHFSIAALLSEYPAEFKMAISVVAKNIADPWLAQVYDLMVEHGFKSLLLAPILIEERLAGFIELKTTASNFFNQQDCTLAQSVATSTGQAINTALLYQNLHYHAESLEDTVAQRTRELKKERDHTQAILESLGDAVIVTDISGKIQYLNPAAVTLTGFSMEEAIGQSWSIWQIAKSRELGMLEADGAVYREISEVVQSGEIWHGEVNNKRKDGTLYDALLTVAPLKDPDDLGHIIGFVSIQSNITSLKEAERLRTIHQEREKQAALDRLRHTFLSTINHEMRTPLVLVFQGIEMLEEGHLGELADEQRDALMTIRRQSWKLGQMVEGLTRVAAFLSKQETVRPVLAQLEPVFNNILSLAEFKARNKELTVETDIAPNLPVLPLDVKQMDEALNQLVDNAIKFNKTGGKIRISAHADSDWVIIAVADTGVGIEADELNRIWEVFEQGSDPLRRAQEGLGLGLVLARYIIEAHRGKIEIETQPGKGSIFTVKLPRTKATARLNKS